MIYRFPCVLFLPEVGVQSQRYSDESRDTAGSPGDVVIRSRRNGESGNVDAYYQLLLLYLYGQGVA